MTYCILCVAVFRQVCKRREGCEIFTICPMPHENEGFIYHNLLNNYFNNNDHENENKGSNNQRCIAAMVIDSAMAGNWEPKQ